jgi:pimeloyl-ACP methyl ester carboxylesterase
MTFNDTNESDPAQVVDDLERRARRFETPCGDGSLVWHVWGNGPAVLLTHGAGGSWMHWIRNIDALAAKRTVWAVDLPGYGDSAMPPSPDHRAISDTIATGLRQLIGPELPIDVVGFSLGGVVAAHLAAFHPELMRRLILVDTGGVATPMNKVRLQRVRGLDVKDRKEVNRANLLVLMLRHPNSVDELALYVHARHGAKGRLDAAPLVMPDKLLQVLPRVSVQLDAIWGEYDLPHPDPAVQENVMRRSHPDMEFKVIRDAGHWVMYERPTEFNKTLLNLLDRPIRQR